MSYYVLYYCTDDLGEDSCLFFLVLCLVTVVISMGSTMLYCFLGGAYSSICADFSHNTDFFFGFVRRAVDSLTHWFIPASSQPCSTGNTLLVYLQLICLPRQRKDNSLPGEDNRTTASMCKSRSKIMSVTGGSADCIQFTLF